MKNMSILQMVIRIIGVIQLILGIVFWTGNADFLVICHIVLGSILVIALWVLAYQASRAGVSRRLVILAAVWGLILPIWGLSQDKILPGSYNWITQVLHLLFGVGAIGIAEMLAPQMRKKSA
jgi:uncharacterized membrane protein